MHPFPTRFVIAGSSGNTGATKGDLRDYFARLFPDKKVRIDGVFEEFVASIGGSYACGNLLCVAMQAEPGETDDHILEEIALREIDSPSLDPDQVCSVLRFLGSDGSDFLAIPEGHDEVNIVLGYVMIAGLEYVLFIEHEFEDGEDEIHLHARWRNKWDKDDAPLVLVLSRAA